MPGLFQGISTMNSALRAFQTALNVTGNNISNVGTPGYSRQGLQLNEVMPTIDNGHYVGNGVTVASINRIQDAFLYARQIQASSEDGRLGSLTAGLNNVQAVTNATSGSSIGDALTAFYNSWSALGSNPSDPALKQQVQQAGITLAGRVSGMYNDLKAQATQNQAGIKGTIQQVQSLVNQIDGLNKEIQKAQASGASPNDLLDNRDQAVQQLAELVPVKVQPMQDGTVMLYSGQMTLVDQAGAATIPTSFDTATGTLTDGIQTFPIPSGQLGGLFQTAQSIQGYQSQLDNLANSLRTEFNSIHSTGTNALGATGQNFFQDVPAGDPQTGAINFQVDPAIVADTRAIATGVSGNPGDGGLALSMSNLRDSQIASLGGKTFGGFFSGMISGIGQDAANALSQSTTSGSVMQQISQQIQSVSGVSIDEEMSNMLRYQRSYQAAAKALSIFDQTTDDLMNIIR
jgi:flagellar hook-associated protein 1